MFFKDFVTWLDGQPFVLFGCAFFGAWVFMDIIDACHHPYDSDSKDEKEFVYEYACNSRYAVCDLMFARRIA